MKPLVHLQTKSTIGISNVVGSTKEAGGGIDGGASGSKEKPEETVSVTVLRGCGYYLGRSQRSSLSLVRSIL